MSVTVTKFKLEGQGFQGVKVSGTETREKDGMNVIVDVELKYKVPLPTEIFQTVQRLKRYMLDLCGYWHPSFDEFIKQGHLVDQPQEGDQLKMYQHLMQLMDSAEVTGVVNKDAFFIITGKLTNMVGGVVGLSTPLAGPSSGYDRWDFLNRGCRQCLTEIQEYVNERKLRLMAPKQYALFDEKDPERIEQFNSMSDQELLQTQIKNLESKGAIVLMPDDFGHEDAGPTGPTEETGETAPAGEKVEENLAAEIPEGEIPPVEMIAEEPAEEPPAGETDIEEIMAEEQLKNMVDEIPAQE